MSVLRDNERAKFGAELVRLKNDMEAQATDLSTTVVGRRGTLLAMLARVENEPETFTSDDGAEVQGVIDYQDALIKTTIEAMTAENRAALVEILTSAGYVVTAP